MTTKQKYSTLDDNVKVAIGRKNLIINGDFSVWQRGTSQISAGFFSDDRWSNNHNGSAKTALQEEFVVGQTDVPNNPKFFSRTNVVAAAGINDYVIKGYKVEDVAKTSGKTMTLSFWSKSSSSSNSIALEFIQSFGTGNSPSASITAAVVKFQQSSLWKKYTHTFTMPSIEGEVLGSNNDHSTAVYFWLDSGSDYDSRNDSLGHQNGNFDISNVQLEFGEVATEFEYVNEADQLARCQRYYQNHTMSQHYYAAEGGGIQHFNFPTSMRGTYPTITLTSSHTAGGNVNRSRPNWVTFTGLGEGELSFTADTEL
jgi:hypothetical protein